MSGMDPKPLSPEEARELSGALRDLPEVEMRPEFRQQLERSFVEGEFAEARRRPRRMRPAVWAWAASFLLAALFLAQFERRGVGWKVEGASGTGSVRIAGENIPVTATDRIQEALDSDPHIEMGEGATLLLGLGDAVLMELTPGLELTLGPPASRFFRREVRAAVHTGELRVGTHSHPADLDLSIQTPDGIVEMIGTVFSVVSDESGTCVCVLEGELRVGRDDASMDEIPAGRRKVLFRDGRAPLLDESAPPHRESLEAFRRKLKR